MSIVACAVLDDCVHVVGDGVHYDPDGKLRRLSSKIVLKPEISTIIATTGIGAFGRFLDFTIDATTKIQDFDGLVSDIGDCVSDTLHRMMIMDMLGENDLLTVLIAGWSESRNRFEAYRMMNYDKPTTVNGESRTIEAFTLQEIEGLWMTRMPSKASIDAVGLDTLNDDPLMSCIKIVCANRQESGPSDEGYFNAGGFIQVAKLTRDAVSSSIIHRWPEDVIGKPVDPSRGVIVP